MNTLDAFAMGMAHIGCEPKVFDWDKAASIIKQHKDMDAFAGLSTDLEWTGGWIYRNGKPVYDSYTYLASTWAIPILILVPRGTFDIPDEEDSIECWNWKSQTFYNAESKWSESALQILRGDAE